MGLSLEGFWRGILKLRRWLLKGKIEKKKEEKKKGNRRIFLFGKQNLGLRG